jgi:alpha-glucosidase
VHSGALRLHFGAGSALDSIFLVEHPSDSETQGDTAATKAGSLERDAASGAWKLKNSSGDVLATIRARFGARPLIEVATATSSDLYGAGNGAPSLIQHEAKSGVANGIAIEPFAWSTAGFAMLAVSADDNTPAQWRQSPDDTRLTWSFPSPRADLYLMPAPTLKDAVAAYARLCGHAPVPPRWALGYLQSRWGWKDRAYINDTLHAFREKHLPVDGFIFDFEWYTARLDYRVPPQGLADFPDFRFNPLLFPEPKREIAQFLAQGLHTIVIRKPRLGDTETLNEFRRRGWIMGDRAKEGENYHARDIDFHNPAVRHWYAQQMEPLLKAGIAGWWDDEGEGTFTNYIYWNQAEREAAAAVRPGERFWSLNRAFAPGLDRLGAAAWTGDIASTWAALAATPASLLNWSLAGMPYGACDIGGFKGQDSAELLVRWMQAGVFFPVMRAHSTFSVAPRFPWLYGPEAEGAIRGALDLRYRLFPYLYALAHECARTGLPPMRPMTMEFPRDRRLRDRTDEWMLGASLLAAPILAPGGERQVVLPRGRWLRFDTAEAEEGGRTVPVKAALDEIPLYVRAGTLLPLSPITQTTQALPGGPLELQVYPGGDAEAEIVEDDGATMAYADGNLRRTAFHWDESIRRLTWRQSGPYAGADIYRSLRIKVFGAGAPAEAEVPLGPEGEWLAR